MEQTITYVTENIISEENYPNLSTKPTQESIHEPQDQLKTVSIHGESTKIDFMSVKEENIKEDFDEILESVKDFCVKKRAPSPHKPKLEA